MVITPARFGVDDLMAQVLGPKQERGRRDDGARPPDGVVDDPHLGTVGHAYQDAVAGTNTKLTQASRDPAGPLEQRPRAMPCPLEQQRRVIALELKRALSQPREVLFASGMAGAGVRRKAGCGQPIPIRSDSLSLSGAD